MLRDRREKEQLVRKFEEIAPFLKGIDTFGWLVPQCDSDPIYRIFPDTSKPPSQFRPFNVNIKTGWHSEIAFIDDEHRKLIYIPEGIGKVDSRDWSDYCYRANCPSPAHIPYPRRTND